MNLRADEVIEAPPCIKTLWLY